MVDRVKTTLMEHAIKDRITYFRHQLQIIQPILIDSADPGTLSKQKDLNGATIVTIQTLSLKELPVYIYIMRPMHNNFYPEIAISSHVNYHLYPNAFKFQSIGALIEKIADATNLEYGSKYLYDSGEKGTSLRFSLTKKEE